MTAALVSVYDLTAEQVDEALALLVRLGGNCKRTSDELRERGIEVSRDALGRWKASIHQERYLELADQFAKQSKDRAIVQGFREMLQEGQDISAELRQRLQDGIDSIDAKDIPKALQQLHVAMGIATEKTLLLEGRPTEIRETRNPDWYEARLRELAEELQNTVDGSCEEDNSAGQSRIVEPAGRSGATATALDCAAQTRDHDSGSPD